MGERVRTCVVSTPKQVSKVGADTPVRNVTFDMEQRAIETAYAEPLCSASPTNDKDALLMVRAHRMSAARIFLLILSVALWSVTADQARAATSSSSHETASLLASKRGASESPGTSGLSPVEPTAPFRFFSPTSFWNEPVPADAAVDPSSAAMVGAFDEEILAEEHVGDGPWINTTSYSVPVYTAPAGQSTVPVELVGSPNAALASAWSAVPLPPTAQPAVGSDGNLFLWQPSTDRLWEFWRLVHEAGGWQASWGGAMQNVSSDPGVYGPEAWPGAQSRWGVSASSLSLVGGLISLEDLKMGQINHALEMSIPGVRGGVYASPAQRTDGKSTNPLSLPEGAHLRLNSSLNLAALHLPRLTLMLAEAAQRYGIFITDSSTVAVFDAQDPTTTGTNPYTSPAGYFEGKYPNKLLASFPWSQLQLLKMDLHNTK
jgi:hypothetical protein